MSELNVKPQSILLGYNLGIISDTYLKLDFELT